MRRTIQGTTIVQCSSRGRSRAALRERLTPARLGWSPDGLVGVRAELGRASFGAAAAVLHWSYSSEDPNRIPHDMDAKVRRAMGDVYCTTLTIIHGD